jgi:hypothetical protein
MVAKALWASVLVVSLLAVGGLGFAAFTASYQININGTAGTLGLSITNDSVMVSNSYVGCYATWGSDYVNFSAGPFAPGDYCIVFANVTNTGNIPAAVHEHATQMGACFEWAVNSPGHSNPGGSNKGHNTMLAPGASWAFVGVLELNPADNNTCQGATSTLAVTFTATAGTNGTDVYSL